ANGETEDLAALNRDPDKAYEITKDKHVSIDYYLSDTSVKAALEAGVTATQVLGQVLDRMLANGDLSPQERADARKLEPYMNDPKVRADLHDCTGHASNSFSPFSWIIPSAHANAATCTAVASDGTVITVLKQVAMTCLDSLKQIGQEGASITARVALRAALGTAGFYFAMTGEAGGAVVDETFTAADGSTVKVTGRGDSVSRTVTITTAAGSAIVLNLQPGANGKLVLENGTVNGQSMNNGMLQDAVTTLQFGGMSNVILNQSNGSTSSSNGNTSAGSAGTGDPCQIDPSLCSDYDTSDTGKGAKQPNVKTDVTADQFKNNLISNGYKVVSSGTSKNGSFTVLSRGSTRYTIYTRSSTGGNGAQYVGPDGRTIKFSLK
ncbi:hypothetical protein CQ054_22885, partial [Ochrobactrum sp. MYb29]